MRKKFFSFENKLTSKSVYDSLPKKEQEHLNKFKDYILISAGKLRAEAGITEVLRFKVITGKSLFNLDLEDLRYFLKELQESDFANHTKNKIKSYIQRFLRWGFKDWSEKFNEFEDIKINTKAQRKKPITSKEMISEEDIKKLLEAEPSLYWKTFLITQAEGGLRTGEVRNLTWDMIDFEDDGFTTLNIPCKKNKQGTTEIKPVVVKIAGRFLKKLKEQQRKYDIKTKYVFPSPQDANKPISKAVNLWFNSLCKRVLGHSGYNYLLRHSKGTELQKKVREGTLSKDNAVEFMRHSEKMFDKVYSHMNEENIKQLIKKQIYNTKELTKEENNKIKELEKMNLVLIKGIEILGEKIIKTDKKNPADIEVLKFLKELKTLKK
jgi:integrase